MLQALLDSSNTISNRPLSHALKKEVQYLNAIKVLKREAGDDPQRKDAFFLKKN